MRQAVSGVRQAVSDTRRITFAGVGGVMRLVSDTGRVVVEE